MSSLKTQTLESFVLLYQTSLGNCFHMLHIPRTQLLVSRNRHVFVNILNPARTNKLYMLQKRQGSGSFGGTHT